MSGPKLLEHTGAHILHDPHIKDADNPCGLCLNMGSPCVFRLIKRNKVDQIDMTNSQCPNLRKIQLMSAGKYSKASPCTNVPLRCPLCLKESDCVWKYNLRAHILDCHLSATIDLYQHLFAFTEDEFVLMKGIYLSKRRKSKKKTRRKLYLCRFRKVIAAVWQWGQFKIQICDFASYTLFASKFYTYTIDYQMNLHTLKGLTSFIGMTPNSTSTPPRATILTSQPILKRTGKILSGGNGMTTSTRRAVLLMSHTGKHSVQSLRTNQLHHTQNIRQAQTNKTTAHLGASYRLRRPLGHPRTTMPPSTQTKYLIRSQSPWRLTTPHCRNLVYRYVDIKHHLTSTKNRSAPTVSWLFVLITCLGAVNLRSQKRGVSLCTMSSQNPVNFCYLYSIILHVKDLWNNQVRIGFVMTTVERMPVYESPKEDTGESSTR